MALEKNTDGGTHRTPVVRAFKLWALMALMIISVIGAWALAEPVISPRGGVFASNVLVSIAASTNQIRYTLDGSEPGTNAPLYLAPLSVTNSVMLKAR